MAERDVIIAALRVENAELRARLDVNSQNSSKPPSTDSPFEPKPAPRSLRRRSGRRPGGQGGHEGTTLRQVESPDHVVEHEPSGCGVCGATLAGFPETARTRRQVFDLPPTVIEVTEHQLIERQCACGARTRAAAPAGVGAPVQYGPQILAVIVYLYMGQSLSKKRTAQAMAELFALPISDATVAAAVARAAAGLDGFLAEVRDRLRAAEVVNFDETGLGGTPSCVGSTRPPPGCTP